MVKIAVVNVVATAALNQELDLDEIGKLREILHDSEIYGGRVAYFKTSEMEGKVSIFASGKMISVGTTSEEKAFYELEYAKTFLNNEGFIKPTLLQPKVRNIVVTTELGEGIDIEALSRYYKTVYEPEQFPGAILRIETPYKATILVFSSARAVITGLKSSHQIVPTIHRLMDILKVCGCIIHIGTKK